MVYIDPDFRRVVESHLAGNLVVAPTGSPLILGIFGPAGEGKTYQIDHLCAELGLRTSIISPGELESENAGHPAQLIRREYLAIGTRTERGVLVVNDLDTVLGDWGSLVQYTVNRQVVFGQLMALCDYPTSVAGAACERVPIIITGNNPSALYGPLMRPGRTRIYAWTPTAEGRAPVVETIFPEIQSDQVSTLVSKFPKRPVSFWADVRATLWEAVLADWIDSDGGASLRQLISRGQKMRPSATPYSIEAISEVARNLDSSDVRDSTYI
ncbi:AAA family ATPase [Cryptosporangium sp. NPDC051539]|uniref:AAA family ATPase n=1 Tax=Cryptosporangium sp. NPDC051539 TaxID=3363962 RepID=UPI0037942C4A